jgi:hypothetical protein
VNRIFGIVSAMLLALVILVPVAVAADPDDLDEHLVFNTGGDVTLAAGQRVDLLVVNNGTATIEGDAKAVVVIDGTAKFVGGTSHGVLAIASTVTLDAASAVSGDVRTINSHVESAVGATVRGRVLDGFDFVGTATVLASVLFIVYLGFVVAMIAAGLLVAALASRQVRSAGSLIGREPGMSILAAIAGLTGIIVASTLAIVTIVGIPLGLGLLVVLLPLLAVAGYLVAGIWIGEWIVGRLTPSVRRERPYLAAFVGIVVLGAVGWIPPVGGIVTFVGFGAVVLLILRTFSGQSANEPTASNATMAASAS